MKVDEVLSESWDIFLKNFVALIIGSLVVGIGSLLIITAPPLLFGLYGMALKGIRGEEVEIADVFDGFNYFVKSWVFLIVAGLLLMLGLVLLVVPGLVIGVLMIYAVPLILIEDLGAVEGIQKSIDLAKRNFKFSLILAIVVVGISIVGGVIRIGWILTTPFTALCEVKATEALLAKE